MADKADLLGQVLAETREHDLLELMHADDLLIAENSLYMVGTLAEARGRESPAEGAGVQ
jgi:hypothetical protein